MSSRLLTDEIAKSKKLPGLSPDSLNLFFLLVPHYTVHGKLSGDPYFIKGKVCPRFVRFTVPKIEKMLKEISDKTNVKWFQVDGLWYLHCLAYSDHQPGLRKDRSGKDVLPNFPKETPELPDLIELQDNSGSSPLQVPLGSRIEEVGSRIEEGEGNLSAPGPEKFKYGEYQNVYLTDAEWNKLITDYSQKVVEDQIEKLSLYICSQGKTKKYRNHSATIRSWFSRDKVRKIRVCTAKEPMPHNTKETWRHPDMVEQTNKETGAKRNKCPHCELVFN